MSHYIYLFVRDDLSPSQQIIQTSHAVDELNKYLIGAGKELTKATNFMVLFSVRNEAQLFEVKNHLDSLDILNQMFYEPDISSFTAIATEPLIGDQRLVMSQYKLKTD